MWKTVRAAVVRGDAVDVAWRPLAEVADDAQVKEVMAALREHA